MTAPGDVHADATHNEHDVQFLHNMAGSLDGTATQARAVISNGQHPDVIVTARSILSMSTDHSATVSRLATQLGHAAPAGSATSSTSTSSGHGNSGGDGNSGGNGGGGRGSSQSGEQRATMTGTQMDTLLNRGFAHAEPRSKRREPGAVLYRSVPFEIQRSGDGLTLEGYAAVFDSPTHIASFEGDFEETIQCGAFTRSLQTRSPVLMFEHGRHPLIGSMPLGVITRAEEDSKGLFIEARLSDNWLIQPVRDAVRDGGVNGMSFRFSVPEGGDTWEVRSGKSDLRTINQADVSELGPVVFPAYEPTTASIRSLVERLPDLTGRPDAWRAGGGVSNSLTADQLRLDEGALRARGIIR